MGLGDIVEIVTLFFAGVGLIAGVFKAIEAWTLLKVFSWDDVNKYTKKVIKKMGEDSYVPDAIVGIGRGGAIFGALLSGNVKVEEGKNRNIMLLGVDRIYDWSSGARVEVENRMVDFTPLKGMKVLLVACDVTSGNTMISYKEKLLLAAVSEVKTGCLIEFKTSTFTTDYPGKKVSTSYRMPWMYKGYGYSRDSRTPKAEQELKMKRLLDLKKKQKSQAKETSTLPQLNNPDS